MVGSVHTAIRHYDDGDRFGVMDRYSDGHGVRGYLKNEGETVWYGTVYNGNGDEGAETSFSYDVKAGVKYKMIICTVDGSAERPGSNCERLTITE